MTSFSHFQLSHKGLNFWCRRFPTLIPAYGAWCWWCIPEGVINRILKIDQLLSHVPPLASLGGRKGEKLMSPPTGVLSFLHCGGFLARCEDQPEIEEVFPISRRKSKPNARPRPPLAHVASFRVVWECDSARQMGTTTEPLARFYENILDGRSVFLCAFCVVGERASVRFAIGSSTTTAMRSMEAHQRTKQCRTRYGW